MPYLLFKTGSKPGKINKNLEGCVRLVARGKFSHPIVVMKFGFPNM